MNKTPSFQLNQWEPNDRVLREDFNADNAKLDAALAALSGRIPNIAAGTYTGDGQAERFLDLGFTPKAVYVCIYYGATYVSGNAGSSYRGGLAVTGAPISSSGQLVLEVAENGFRVFYSVDDSGGTRYTCCTNQKDSEYHYLALSW